MKRTIRAILTLSSVAAVAVWIRRTYAFLPATSRNERDDFAELYQRNPGHYLDIDDDAVADIIRRAKPALERARQVL
jgi:hypothetical protein